MTIQPAQESIEKQQKPWDETIKTLLFALVLALAFRSFAYEPFHIPSGSMKDTLLVGDYLFVSKYHYGYSRYSFPFGFPLFKGRVLELNEPQRGDVVVFRQPANPRIDFIKRLIGLPGDKIQVKDGVLYINGNEVPRKEDRRFLDDENKQNIKSIAGYLETLPEGKVIRVLDERNNGPQDNTPVYVVPAKHYFMMGDNRDNSRDSRYLEEVGYVPEENIVGRAEMIFFSTDGTADMKNPVSWFKAMRGSRFFKIIH
jgi:signal peptidase I